MKLVILEREAVMRFDPQGASPREWLSVNGSLEALADLQREGWRVVVTAHQAGVTRGAPDMEALSRMHNWMLETVRKKGGDIEAFFICPHAPDDDCRCRTPRPGLFEDIAERLKINLAGAYAVGLSLAYIEAARTAASLAVLLGEERAPQDVPVFPDLAAFTEHLLAGRPSP
jgi:D-glycero-D-manno-heptose 1,7-bisphosphate phosphatase